ncbi:MAG: hypothetical protein ACI9SP_003131 [Arenicella sp.]|jgi:hypothetical protein
MLIDIQNKDDSIIFIIEGETIEFTKADLASIGISASIVNDMLKRES